MPRDGAPPSPGGPQDALCRTHPKCGAFLDDSGQLREADVDGEVPGLPAREQRDTHLTDRFSGRGPGCVWAQPWPWVLRRSRRTSGSPLELLCLLTSFLFKCTQELGKNKGARLTLHCSFSPTLACDSLSTPTEQPWHRWWAVAVAHTNTPRASSGMAIVAPGEGGSVCGPPS